MFKMVTHKRQNHLNKEDIASFLKEQGETYYIYPLYNFSGEFPRRRIGFLEYLREEIQAIEKDWGLDENDLSWVNYLKQLEQLVENFDFDRRRREPRYLNQYPQESDYLDKHTQEVARLLDQISGISSDIENERSAIWYVDVAKPLVG